MNDNFILDITGALEKSKSQKQINSDIKELEKVINMLRLTGTFATGDTKNELNSYIKSLQSQLDHIKLKAEIDSRNIKNEFNKALNNITFEDIDLLNIDENKVKLKVKKVIADVKAYAEKTPITINIESKKTKLNNDLITYLNRNTKINESSVLLNEADKVQKLIDAINDNKTLREATDAFRLYKSEVSATGFNTQSTTDKIKGMITKVTKIGSTLGVASMAVNKFSDSMKTLKTNDTILTEISKTSELTKQQLTELGNESFKKANKYGQLSSNYLLGVQEMARSGYESLSRELGELSLLAQSAGDMTAEMANNYLLATDAAYKYGGSVDKLNAALDGANYISNRNSASLSDIADATRVSASFAANANVAIDELTAAEATMIAVTKRSGSEIGRAFRSILLNLQQVSGEFDGEVIDEAQLKKVEERCHSLGVELEYVKDGVATLRDPMEVLKDLARVYNSLPDNSADKQGLISDIGGKYHANALSALLSRWDLYEKMLGEFSQGTGSALEEANKTADSWEGRLAQLQNSWDSFVNSIMNKEAVLSGISFFDRMIQGAETLTDTIGEIPVILGTLQAAMTAMNKDYGITSLINEETGKFDIQGNIFGIDFTNIKNLKKHFLQASEEIKYWNKELNNGKVDLDSFSGSLVKSNAQFKAYLQTTSIDAPASLSGYKAYLNSVGVSTDALRLKTILLNTVIGMGIGIAIQAAVQGITYLIQREEELRQQAEEAAQAYKESSSSIDDYVSRYQELRKALIAAKGNEEETYNIKKQLLDLQTDINNVYGEEYGKLDLVTNAYRDQTEAIKNYNKELANTYLNENEKGIRNAEKQMTKNRHYQLSYSGMVATTDKGKALKEIAEKYKDKGISISNEGDVGTTFSILLDTDAESAYSVINDFETDLRNKAIELGDEHLFDDVLEVSSDSLNNAKSVIDDYGEIFKRSLIAKIASDDKKATVYNDALKAVEEYNNVVLASEDPYSDEKVASARQNLEDIKQSIQGNTEEWGQYSSVMDDVFDQADTRLIDFNDRLQNDDSLRKYAEELKGLDALDLQSFDQNVGKNNAFDQLKESAGSCGVSVEELIDRLVKLGIVQDNVKSNTFNDETEISLSLPDAQKLVNGLKDGETETLGLIDELSLLQEILSDTGNIQQETYAKLLSCSSKYSAAIRTENGRITLNTTKLKQVAKSRQLDTQETIKQTIALMKQNWLQWANNIDNYNGTLLESITSKYNDIDALQNEITQYELLANSVNEASNAFESFKTAQSTNDQDMYDTAQEMFNVLKGYSSDPNNENYGKYNRDEFQEAAINMMDTATYKKFINAKDLGEAEQVVKSFVKSVEPLFDEKNYNSAANLFDRIEEIINSGDIPKADKDWAKRLGIDEELFHGLSIFGNQYSFAQKEIFESYQLNTLDNYYEKLQAVKSAKDALNAIEDNESKEYFRQEAELNRLTESYNNFVNDTAQKVSQAFADFQQNPEGKSFADYLKKSFDFDDNDITGSLMAIIDKSGDLQKTLDSISLNEVVQSQQEEYQELQNLNQIISTLNENGYSSVDVEVKNKSNFNEVYSEYEKLKQKVLEYQEAISNSDNPHEINELNGYLSECVSNMDKLREPLRIEIEANIERVNSQLESVKSKINELNSQTSLSPYQQERLGVLQGEQAALESQQATLEAQLKIVVDSTDVDDYKPEDKEGTVSYSPDFSQVESAVPPTLNGTVKYTAVIDTSGLAGSLGGFPQTSSGTSSTSNTGASSNGGSHAKGTVGNAFANGYNGLPANEKNALRSEYGQKEMTVYPDGRYEITETPTLSDLPKGTVIFNEKQTNRILKGISHFKGTVGKAFAPGTGTKINLPNLVDVISNNNAVANKNNKDKSNNNNSSDSTSHAVQEAQEATEEFFDWIERRIKRFQALFDKWIKQAETAVTSGFINKYYKKATSAIKNELSTYGKAYKRYMKQADSIGLSKKYRDKVKDGTIDIESIKDEKLAEQIKKYQEWCVNTPLYLVTGGGILFNC